MLVTFKSASSGDVLMFGDTARELIRILGKDPDDSKGIVTVEQLPEAIARLGAAIEEDRKRQAARDPDQDEIDKEEGRVGMNAPVSFSARAWPLLDMLELAHKDGVPVVWGV